MSKEPKNLVLKKQEPKSEEAKDQEPKIRR